MFHLKSSITGILFGLSIVFFILYIFMMLQDRGANNESEDSRNNVALVVDISNSMNVADMQNQTRLEATKSHIIDQISNYPGTRFSLTLFAGEPLRVLPLSSDTDLLQTFLSSVTSQQIASQGTRLDKALVEGVASFGDDDSGTMIVYTDGGEDISDIDQKLIEEIHKKNINILFVAVGSKEGGKIISGYDIFGQPIYKFYQGKPVVSKLDIESLREIAYPFRAEVYDLSSLSPMDYNFEKINSSTIKESRNFLLMGFVCWLLFIALSWSPVYISQRNYETH